MAIDADHHLPLLSPATPSSPRAVQCTARHGDGDGDGAGHHTQDATGSQHGAAEQGGVPQTRKLTLPGAAESVPVTPCHNAEGGRDSRMESGGGSQGVLFCEATVTDATPTAPKRPGAAGGRLAASVPGPEDASNGSNDVHLVADSSSAQAAQAAMPGAAANPVAVMRAVSAPLRPRSAGNSGQPSAPGHRGSAHSMSGRPSAGLTAASPPPILLLPTSLPTSQAGRAGAPSQPELVAQGSPDSFPQPSSLMSSMRARLRQMSNQVSARSCVCGRMGGSCLRFRPWRVPHGWQPSVFIGRQST